MHLEILRIISLKFTALSLRWKIRRRATPLLPTWIYYCRSGGMVSLALPLIYNKRHNFNFHITHFSFLSSNIPSSPAYDVFISQLIQYVRACTCCECLIYWGQCDFHVSFSGKDMSGNVWNHPSGSSMVIIGISINIMKSKSSPKCYVTFWEWPYTVTPSINHYIVTSLPNWTLLPTLTL